MLRFKFYKMKTAIVTGASGNLGQAVVKKFIDEGYFVIGTVIPNDTIPINFPADKFEKVVVDLMSEEDAQKFIPERFLESENGLKPNQYKFNSFHGGPRSW